METVLKTDNKWECFFIKVIMIFGIIMILIVPIMEVQDEDTHTMRSINMSYFNFDYSGGFNILQSVYTFIEAYTEGKSIYVFESEPDYRINHDVYWNATRIPLNPDEKVFFCDGQPLRTALYGNLAYLPQGVGILIGRFYNLPIFWTLILGRFFKLLFYATLCYWAIKLIPVKKKMMTLLCLMPMSVFFAASLSPDGILVSSCYLFISYCLYSKEKYHTLTKKGILILLFLLAFIFSIKVIYSCIVLFLLIFVDVKKLFFKYRKPFLFIASGIILCVLVLFICVYIFDPIVNMCVKNIPLTVYLYFKTYTTNFSYYLSLGIANFGTGFCPLNKRYIYTISIYVMLVALQAEKHDSVAGIDKKTKYISFVLFFVISVIIFLAGFKMSNLDSIDSDSIIGGIQGRYFTAFIPFILIVLSNKKIKLKWIVNEFAVKMVSIIMLVISNIWILYRYW